jgi:assimilatory nitrate reductase catalytic subunit
MHWGQEVLSGQDDQGQPLTGVNALTTPAFCPTSKQPELKHAAGHRKVDLPWRLSALAWLPAEQALAVREQLRPLLAAFGWASLLPFGREPDAQGRVGLVLRAPPPRRWTARLAPPAPCWAWTARRCCATRTRRPAGPRPAQRCRWPHAAAGLLAGRRHRRRGLAAPAAGGRHACPARPTCCWPRRAGPRPGRGRHAGQPPGLHLLQRAGGRHPPDPGGCAGSPEERLAALTATLRCGSNCGSCIPALRGLVKPCPRAPGGGCVRMPPTPAPIPP